MSDSVRSQRWQPTRLSVPGILQARVLEWGAIAFSEEQTLVFSKNVKLSISSNSPDYYLCYLNLLSPPHHKHFSPITLHIKHTSAEIQKGAVSILGEGDGTPLQYSCLEYPMDGGAW